MFVEKTLELNQIFFPFLGGGGGVVGEGVSSFPCVEGPTSVRAADV